MENQTNPTPVERYRLAWLSARRRARFAVDVVDAEILCGAEVTGTTATWQCELPDGHDGSHWGRPTGSLRWG